MSSAPTIKPSRLEKTLSVRARESLNWAAKRKLAYEPTVTNKVQLKIPFGFWLCSLVIVYLMCLTANGYSGDMDYWIEWSKHLQNNGLAGLKANYPPVFIYWLWGMARLHSWLGVEIAPTYWFKLLINLPVLLSHVGLLFLVYRVSDGVIDYKNNDSRWLLLGAVTLNVALLVNGPVWGQVDVIYGFFVAIALYCLIRRRHVLWALPLFTVSLLTKFQAVCVAPLVLALIWHRRSRALWIGLGLSLVMGCLLLLPYQLAGNLQQMIRETYLNAADLYPYASMNAENLWYALGLNSVSHDVSILPSLFSFFGLSLTPRHEGKLLFVLLALWVLFISLKVDEPRRHWRNAVLLAMGFFMLLPAMHERYLMPAVVIAGAAAALYPSLVWSFLALSFFSAANMWFILHPVGGEIPWLFSLLSLIMFLGWLFPVKFKFIWARCSALPNMVWLSAAVLIWSLVFLKYFVPLLPLSEGWLNAVSITDRQVVQGWGKLGINQSVEGKPLTVKGQTYGHGLGTHAPSRITFRVPVGTEEFHTSCGVDDEGVSGEVECMILLDGVVVRKTGVLKHNETPVDMNVSVREGQELVLSVDDRGKSDWDHVDWLMPRFKLRSGN